MSLFVIFLVFAATFPARSPVVFASRAGILQDLIGTDNVLNNAGDMTIRNMALSGDTQLSDQGDSALLKGRSYEYLVVTGVTSVTSWCKMTNATGYFEQKVLSWSTDPKRVQPIPCGEDCLWTVDTSGFWVTNSDDQPKFVVGWNHGTPT